MLLKYCVYCEGASQSGAEGASQSGEKGKTKVETKGFVFTGVGSSASSDLVQVWRCLRSPVYLYASEKTSLAVTSSNIRLDAPSTTAKAVAMRTLAMILLQNLGSQCRPLEAKPDFLNNLLDSNINGSRSSDVHNKK